MISIKKFVFSPFYENTYLIYSGSDCWIIDPGCFDASEQSELQGYIKNQKLKPKRLINTHCHIDHVFGNAFVHRTYGLKPMYHALEEQTLKLAAPSAMMYGINDYEPSPTAETYLEEGDVLKIDGKPFEVIFVPGHAPGHIALISHEMKWVIGGDVLFEGSIGRTDLPGGDFDTLIGSIKSKLLTLPDDYLVFCGHGNETTIGRERQTNPFLIN
ncbi:MAG: MBL fold metallo-hydrolase [Salibacteraceae bacterium]